MTTQLDVANLALAHLAIGKAIGAMNEATQAARLMTQFYGQARDEALRDFNWPFARKFDALAQVAAAPVPDWGFSYRYPADCLFVRDVYVGTRRPLSAAARIPYIVGQDATGRLIYSSTAALQIEYTVAISEAFWPPDFVSAVSFLLAWYAAPALTAGDPHKLGERARAAYQDVIGRAQLAGENEQEEELSVANLALTHLGVGRPMMSMNEQTQAGRAVHQFYAQIRDEMFRDYNWPFARKFASPLTVVAGPSPRATVDWLYSYRYPSDCLYARRLRNQPRRPDVRAARVPFSIGQDNTGRLIFTDCAPLAASGDWPAFPELEYTVLVSESLWPVDFTGAFAYRLAYSIAPFVTTGDARQLRERMRNEFDAAMTRVWQNHLNEREEDIDEPECGFLTARD